MTPMQFDLLRPGTLIKKTTESVNDYYVLTTHYGNMIVVVQAKRSSLVSALEIPVEACTHWDIVHLRGVVNTVAYKTKPG